MSTVTGMSPMSGPDNSVERPPPRPGGLRRRRSGVPAATGTVRVAVSVVLAILVALPLGGCGSSKTTSSATAVSSATPKIENGTQVFDVVGTASLQFTPATLIAKPGKITVNLTVEHGSPPHNFVISTIPAARTNYATTDTPRSVTFTVDQPGQYPFICTIHPNMRGTLIIS
ncbi:cupredoxin domain-containing protein [Frankia sp. CiP3]|uniref:cupredoxin domain-containing protein n=1 Tax=Frankia sp. CiP3 TaxID=2880971 RepID=UPI001EF67B99|nr:cupredoxin domain-containing protein [Frankia sp. CiP3]